MEQQVNVSNLSQQEIDAAYPEYMSFAACSKELGVRFQQVYQRAVVRGKMRWISAGKHKLVLKADVDSWKKVRAEYFSNE